MEVGNCCFDQCVFEEINCKIVDYLSDINMFFLEYVCKYLLVEGLCLEIVIKIGLLMIEVLIYYKVEIEENDVLEKEGLKKGDYFIVSMYCEENVDFEKNFFDLFFFLNVIVDKYYKKVIVFIYFCICKKLEFIGFINFNLMIEFMKFFGFMEYIKF